jgi:hypothetical protein
LSDQEWVVLFLWFFYYFEVVRLSGFELLALGPGDQEWVVLFLLVFYYFELVRLSGFEPPTLGPGDQEWVVLFLRFFSLLLSGTTEWIRTADPWTG